MATKKVASKSHAAAEKPTAPPVKRAVRRKSMTTHDQQPGSVEERLDAIEATLVRVLGKLGTHGMAIVDEPDEENDDPGEPNEGEAAEG